MSGYKPQLDSLRAFAVLAVLIGHFAGVPIAIQGVQLFFVLSGFLITNILLDCKSQIDGQDGRRAFLLRQFYIRRFLRIFPPYYALLLALTLLNALDNGNLGQSGVSFWQSLVFHATYTSNVWFAFTGRWDPWTTSHFWSLAIEEQFYLFWPLIVLWVPRRSLWLAATLLIALGPVSRWLMLAHGLNKIAFGTLTPAYFDFLGLGAFLAIVRVQPRAEFVLRLFGMTASAVIAIGESFAMNFKGLDVFLWALAFTGLVSKASEGFTGSVAVLLNSSPLRNLGRISYGIYLYHLPAVVLVEKSLKQLGFTLPSIGPRRFALAGAVTLALAALSWHFLEAPINRLKRFFPYRTVKSGDARSSSHLAKKECLIEGD